jgi:hypothetical protein
MFAKSLTLSAALTLLITGSGLASPPHRASWKGSGMPESDRGAVGTRYYEPAGYAAVASAPAPQAERRTFSYEPQSAVMPTEPQARRTYSYQPAVRASQSRTAYRSQPNFLRQKADPNRYNN